MTETPSSQFISECLEEEGHSERSYYTSIPTEFSAQIFFFTFMYEMLRYTVKFGGTTFSYEEKKRQIVQDLLLKVKGFTVPVYEILGYTVKFWGTNFRY